MGNTQLPFGECRAFVDASEQDVAEVERPDAVLEFFQAAAMRFECCGQVQQARLEANRADVGDAFHEVVSGILERRAAVRAWRRPIERAWRAPVQELVRPLLVVLLPETVEGVLLERQRRSWGADSALLDAGRHRERRR